jgi:hypothetical protein
MAQYDMPSFLMLPSLVVVGVISQPMKRQFKSGYTSGATTVPK